MQPHANDAALLSTAMKSNFQLGVFSRASRIFMQCNEFNPFCYYVTDTLEELGLSGRIKLTAGGNCAHTPFGQGICPNVYNSLNDLAHCSSKILLQPNFFIFNTQHVLLILDTEKNEAMEIDLLVDNMTIYMDTIHYWLEQHHKITKERKEIEHERSRVVSNLHSFIECITRLNQHLTEAQQTVNEDLLTRLIGIFPIMGMEADQEEIILNIVHDARRKERALIEQQLQQNDDLRTVMRQAIAALATGNFRLHQNHIVHQESASITLF